MEFDVAIIGGGPAGSTCGGLLAKYRPGLKVGIFEREKFPRDHIGESQLPSLGPILNELGVWEKIEAANFPIKIGATYRWGNTDNLWDFHFIPNGGFTECERPGKFQGQRAQTAFQVDRAVYDKLLLDHAQELGCQVFEESGVREVLREGDKVTGLVLANGEKVTARYYVDASGHVGTLRRAMGVGIEEPSKLRNIAIWDYWQNAEWAVTIGAGGTRVQVLSVDYGWLWFIPLSSTRTSLGLVCPADYYKASGLSREELYLKAIADEPRLSKLVEKATRENNMGATKDWSFVAERMTGENWLLVGEALGFADPILAAGLTLTHVSAREAAFTILEMDRAKSKKWLREQYEHRNRRRVMLHIRFAEYWYTANTHFGELKQYTSEIAKDEGLELDAEKAFQWLGTGGFIEEDTGPSGLGTVNVRGLHQLSRRFSEKGTTPLINGMNGFIIDLHGAEKVEGSRYENGEVISIPGYRRNGKFLPLIDMFSWVVPALQHSPRMDHIIQFISDRLAKRGAQYDERVYKAICDTLEMLARDGWITCKCYKSLPPLDYEVPDDQGMTSPNRDFELPEYQRASSIGAEAVGV